jgi:tetratricopeptide (TPR) repeat protein
MARVRDIAEVVRAFQRARGPKGPQDWGGVVLLVGAGCSASAGIPLSAEIAEAGMLELARSYSNHTFEPSSPQMAFDWLKQHKRINAELEWAQAYGELFESHFSDPAKQRPYIRDAVGRARGINWAHVSIGELVRCHYVHTVLTTNFDQLALEGLVRAGLIPVVADGVEALSRIEDRPASPQLVHIHGTAHTYRQRNSRFDVEQTSRIGGVVGVLRGLLLGSEALVVIGYAGGEEGVMQVLLDAAREAGEKTIYWILYDGNPDRLSPRAQELLSFSRGGGVVVGQDADSFFAEIARQLGIGVPHWMRAPIETLADQAKKLVQAQDALIASQVTTYQGLLTDLAACLQQRQTRSGPEHQIHQAEKLALEGRADDAQRVLDTQPGATVPPELLESLADAAMSVGRQARDDEHLERAVEGYRRALAALAAGRPAVEVRLRTKLGDALTVLGHRTATRDLLDHATAELRRASDLADPRDMPLEFAEAQRALGSALIRLAQREQGTELLNEGVAAYNRALGIYTREALPLLWAKVQNNIGNALQKLADRTDAPSRLREAVTAYRSSLEVFTREAVPAEWAATLNNMGNALQRLGWAEVDDRPVTEAIAAYRESLAIYTASTFPLDWAMTQTNLGSALETIGRRQRRTDALADALTAYRAALQVYARDSLEVDWARTQGNIANALRSLGRIEQNSTLLEQAISAHHEALQVYTAERLPHDWAASQHDLGVTLLALAEQTGGTERLDDALAALRHSQEVNTRDAVAVRWGSAQRHIARALLLQGERTRDRRILEAARAHATNGLEPPIPGMVPDDRAGLTATREAATRALQALESAP